MPPWRDDALPGRGKPEENKRAGGGGAGSSRRSRGKQRGAERRHLPGTASPDATVCHRPAGRCGCGADLAGAVDVGVERANQAHDLLEIDVTVTQHELWPVRCRCGTPSLSG